MASFMVMWAVGGSTWFKEVSRLRVWLVMILCAGLVLSNVGTACAAVPEEQGLTLQQAIDKAVAYNPALRAKALSIDQAEYNREAAAAAVTFTPTGQTDPDTEKKFLNLVQKDLNWQAAKKDYAAQKDSVVIQVYKAYFGVLQAQAALESAQKSLDYAGWQKRGAVLKHQFGAASAWEVEQQADAYEAARAELAAATQSLDNAYQKFEQLLGLSAGSRPQLTERPSFVPLEVTSLDAAVSRVLEESPSVWKSKQAITQAQIALDIYSFGPAEANTYKATEQGVAIAENNLNTVKDEQAQAVRSLYYSIKQVESNYQSLAEKLRLAERNLNLTRLKLANGTASRAEAAKAEAEAAQARTALLDATCQHLVLVRQFLTPWAA